MIAWAVFLCVLPFPALPLYWLIGESSHGGYLERREQVRLKTREREQRVGCSLESYRTDSPYFSLAEKLTGLVPTGSNHVELYTENERAFQAILHSIEKAEAYVLAQFYVIREDGAGREFLDTLEAAAQRGVRVYLYLDPLESSLSQERRERLKEAGVEVAEHQPGKGGIDPLSGNFRNHRKLVVVDGSRCLLGGMNIGDNYLSRIEELSPWNDLFLKLEGPAVLNTQLSFLRDYLAATGCEPECCWEASVPERTNARVAVFPTDPADTWDACGLAFTSAITGAKERVVLASPYFLPDEKGRAALQIASLGGVRVQVLRPHKTMVKTADVAAWHFIEELLPGGVEFYRQPEGLLHKKLLLIDSDLVMIGSANFDYRSFHLNHELFLWIESPEIVSQVEEMLEEDLSSFARVEADDLEKRGDLERIMSEAASLATPLL